MNELITQIVVLELSGALLIMSIAAPFLIATVAIWVGLWVAELTLSAFPLVGKPLAWVPHKLRELFTKLLGKIWSVVAKIVARFARAVGRGLMIVLGRFARAVGRGAKRIAVGSYNRIRGTSPTPPPAPPPTP